MNRARPLFATLSHHREIYVQHFPHKIMFNIPLSLELEKSLLVKEVVIESGRMVVELVRHSNDLVPQTSAAATPGLEYVCPRLE